MAVTLLFGIPLSDKCYCGAEVDKSSRQQIDFDEENNRWVRVCGNCLNNKPKHD